MEQNQQPEALALASIFEIRVKMFGEPRGNPEASRAAKELRRLHARNQELEAMLDAVGAGGVSAQRVTQGKDHIAQDRKMVSAPVVLPDGWKIVPVEPTPPMVEAGATERITPHITAGHGAIAAFKAMLEHAPEYPALASTTAAAPGVPNLDDYYCKGCGRIGEIEELSAQDKAKLRKLDGKPKTAPVMEPVLSDVLPAIGSRVFIRHRRDNDAHACIVTGYYAWEDDGGNPMLHRVFVRLVYEGTNTSQSCILCECHPSAEAALAATPTTAAQSEVPKVGSDWRHKNGNTYRVVAIANDCDAHFSERYPVTVVYQGENGKMWARRADDWHRSMTHDATAPSTALVERPG